MFVVGTHVPVRDTTLADRRSRRRWCGPLAVGAVAAVLGVVAGAGVRHRVTHLLYAVLMASSSAALALPVIDSLKLSGPPVLSTTAQIAIADAASIILLPLVIDPSHARPGGTGRAWPSPACAALLFIVLRDFERNGNATGLHRYSEDHRQALELRISLIMLFSLAALAVTTHVSIMLAGFALGLVVSGVGEPRRLARQLFGITEGFFGPLFFVWLGASLQVRELGERPEFICARRGPRRRRVAGALRRPVDGPAADDGRPGLGAVGRSGRRGRRWAEAQNLLSPGEPSALILGALITVAITSVAGRLAAGRSGATAAESPERHDDHDRRGQRQRRGDQRGRCDAGIEGGAGRVQQRVRERRRQIASHRDRTGDALPGIGGLARREAAGQLDVGPVERGEDGAQRRSARPPRPARRRFPKPRTRHRLSPPEPKPRWCRWRSSATPRRPARAR